MQFKDVIGQPQVKHHLVEMVQQNRLSHALLFLGREGAGALPLALAFSQYVVCEKVNGQQNAFNAGPGLFGDEAALPAIENMLNDSCGVCPACIKAQQFVHPDIHFSYPVISKKTGEKPVSRNFISEWRDFVKDYTYGNVFDWLQMIGAENKQGNITAEECNEIIRQLNLKSFESDYKILLLWMPEYLGKEGNKLLKLIEEPPPKTLFILIAENEELILPTILSRCQLIKIPGLEISDIEHALIERSKIPPDTARQIAGISEGNYHEALKLVQNSGDDWQSLLRDWLNAMLKAGTSEQLKWMDEMTKLGRENQKQFLRYFNHLLEQSIRIRILGDQMTQLPEKEKDFALRLNKIAGVSQQQAIIEELDKAAYYIERNAHAKMLFHALTIKLQHIIKNKMVITIN